MRIELSTLYVCPTLKISFGKSMLHLKPIIAYIGAIVTYVSACILLHHQIHWLCRHLYPIPLGDLKHVSRQNLNYSIRIKSNIQETIHVEAKSKIFLTIHLCQKEY